MANNSSPEISVLMAVYNTAAYAREAIESILAQTWTELELIVVDDCSTDGSWEILLDCAAEDARVIVLRNPKNSGASGALNRGLAVARGRFVTRQDSDDISQPERLAEQAHFLAAHPEVGAVGTAVFLVDSSGKRVDTLTFPAGDTEIQRILPDRMCFCGPTVMARRESFVAAGFYFDERFSGSEDYDFCLRLAEVTKLSNLERPLYAYRQHSSSVSHQQRYRQMFREAAALEAAGLRRYGSQTPDDFRALLARDYLRAAVLAYGSSQTEKATQALQHALSFVPTLLEKPMPLAEIIRRYTPRNGVEQALAFSNGLFNELLPHNRTMARLRSRWLAELHMAEVFTGMNHNQPRRIEAHLWPGLRHNPGWLLNRGVAAQAARGLLSRLART